MANMFCGYACIVHAMRGEFATAALFIGFAFVLDMLDGRIARMTGTTSAFGVEFDSLADVDLVRRRARHPVVPVGTAAARSDRMGGGLSLRVGRGRAAGALQHPVRHTGQALLRRHAEPGGGRACRRPLCSRIRPGSRDTSKPWPVLSMVIVPALLMVSTIRFRSFKSLDLQARRSYPVLFLLALGLAALAASPRFLLAGDGVHLSGLGVHRSRLAPASTQASRRRTTNAGGSRTLRAETPVARSPRSCLDRARSAR